MNATVEQDQWSSKELNPAQRENRAMADAIPVAATGVAPQTFAQAVDYAKFMSMAHGVVGPHLIGNVGACLAVMEIARQFEMPYYAVARQTYLVNGRVAFMGQLVHAIINKACPLKRKLTWRYQGEGQNLQIIISGEFKDETEPRVWESPRLSEIRVQNSPLWKTNPKHQFIYFGVRAWQTVHWPEGLLNIQTGDEASALPPVGAANARDVTPAPKSLVERLVDARAGTDGYQDGHAESQIEEMRNGNNKTEAASSQGEKINTAPEAAAEAPAEVKAPDPQGTEDNAQAATTPNPGGLFADSSSGTAKALLLAAIDGCTSKTALKDVWSKSKATRTEMAEADLADCEQAKGAKYESLSKGGK